MEPKLRGRHAPTFVGGVRCFDVKNWVDRFRELDRRFLPLEPQLHLAEPVLRLLTTTPLVVADVGADGGAEPRWDGLGSGVRFVLFEPRADQGQVGTGGTLSIGVALAECAGTRTLNVVRFTQSSSLYEFEGSFVAQFQNAPFLEVTSRTDVPVSTLDRCLDGRPSWKPSFLKVDVEGADLDVLRGATQCLTKSVMGLRVETVFNRFRTGAPSFSDIDHELRRHGFELFHVSREAWIRSNGRCGDFTRPQTIWGDTVYFLGKQAFLQRLESTSATDRVAVVIHMITVLLAHDVHDYAADILTTCRPMMPDAIASSLEETISIATKSTRGRWLSLSVGAAISIPVILLAMAVPVLREPGVFYFKRRVGALLHALWRLTLRGGAGNSSISDVHA
jgi:FkbM family methyltransferase